MNVITSENIKRIGSSLHPEIVFDPTSIAYIQFLLEPYVKEMEPISTIKDVRDWISGTFPKRLHGVIFSESGKAGDKKIKELADIGGDKEEYTSDPEVVSAVKDAVIEYFVSCILWITGSELLDLNIDEQNVLPWDIQKAISNHERLSQIFKIIKDEKRLPVTIATCNTATTEMLTEEFTAGLLLFANVGRFNLRIDIFGTSFKSSLSPSRFIFDEKAARNGYQKYSVEAGGVKYGFNTRDFMKGFETGALFVKADYHNYCKNLLE